MGLLQVTDRGLHCAAGNFHIDPWKTVERALITHAHADHARGGSKRYLCAAPGVSVLRERLGRETSIEGISYGERRVMDGVTVSFHPAGHLLGAAQIRVEHRGEVWVVSGDYKTQPDPTCATFEPVKCDTFVTESTFGLPIYRWPEPAAVIRELHEWWSTNQQAGRTSIVFAYSLGKAQRILAQLDGSVGPILVHPAIAAMLPHYGAEGVRFPPTDNAAKDNLRATAGRALVIAPPAADDSALVRAAGEVSTAFASGWMAVRGTRRWRAADRGFVMSDHADWAGLNDAITATGAGRVLVTHGYTKPLVRWLRERGLEADELATQFVGEREDRE
ncbi:MAG TPA: DNA ligase-associated DEXH box helicase [Verrucomicrobiales bacterium]|nr:DNA ligase-associated DEXH box helicase [Verrucomicrobiales bacterium]